MDAKGRVDYLFGDGVLCHSDFPLVSREAAKALRTRVTHRLFSWRLCALGVPVKLANLVE
jgi:hypothetical protein